VPLAAAEFFSEEFNTVQQQHFVLVNLSFAFKISVDVRRKINTVQLR
jgi:hypothetical protein